MDIVLGFVRLADFLCELLLGLPELRKGGFKSRDVVCGLLHVLLVSLDSGVRCLSVLVELVEFGFQILELLRLLIDLVPLLPVVSGIVRLGAFLHFVKCVEHLANQRRHGVESFLHTF